MKIPGRFREQEAAGSNPAAPTILTMTDDQLKQQVKTLLKEPFGLDAEDIAGHLGSRCPDLRVTSPRGDVTIVELKAKGDDPAELAREREALQQGGIVSRSVPMDRRNTLSGIIEDGVEQLRAYDGQDASFSVLWLHAWGRDADLLMDRFRATLYGTTNIIDMSVTRDTRTGFFIDFNDFHRYRGVLDGAVLSTANCCQLCINSLSSRAGQFRQSGFVAAFAAGLCDPEGLEGRGEAYIADCDIDRRNRQQVMNYVRKKYGRERLLDLTLTKHSAIMSIRDLLAQN